MFKTILWVGQKENLFTVNIHVLGRWCWIKHSKHENMIKGNIYSILVKRIIRFGLHKIKILKQPGKLLLATSEYKNYMYAKIPLCIGLNYYALAQFILYWLNLLSNGWNYYVLAKIIQYLFYWNLDGGDWMGSADT